MNFPDKFPKMKRVGIMGGTFNPIHIGHLLLAENAYSAFGLDQVLFIPSGCSYMKDQSAILDADTRLRMTALAIQDNPHFQVSDMEVRRPGYTYTCETLEQLTRENPSSFFWQGQTACSPWKPGRIRRSFFRRRPCSPPSGTTAETAVCPNRRSIFVKNITAGSA